MIIEKEFHSKCIEKAMTDKCSEKDMTTTINNRGSSFHRLGASSTIHLQSLGQAKKDLNTVETSVVDRYVKLFYPSQEVDQF